ncbi:uncharacterized protein LOC119084943 [Bradysia coprophila]|uniref:uncharacterized protein LOC119084943 n=1 Tax=Bradysia coprophila TaxID=38358 RepID=UPI00187D8A1C|nr:uncharacterized protein LOC119084943 [Bradysia coprophila]
MFLDRDSQSIPKESTHIPSVKLPSRQYRIDPLRKSKPVRYSELDGPKTHDDDEGMSDFPHRERPNKFIPITNHQRGRGHNHPVDRHHHPSGSLPHFHHREHIDKCTVRPIQTPNPSPKDCKQTDISKLLSRIQADYFACCDDCRRKMVRKYATDGCSVCSKSPDPIVMPDVPCEKEILSPKCACDHNKNILENLKKISEKLCELSAARSAKIRREKEKKNGSDVKKDLLQQLNKIYEKLSSLKSTDEIENSCPKQGSDCACSKCTEGSNKPSVNKMKN